MTSDLTTVRHATALRGRMAVPGQAVNVANNNNRNNASLPRAGD